MFERCQHSTEFHFPDIESQLTTVEQDFARKPDSLQEGSFFVTRHSNLPLTQVIFHLVIDSDGKHLSIIYIISQYPPNAFLLFISLPFSPSLQSSIINYLANNKTKNNNYILY